VHLNCAGVNSELQPAVQRQMAYAAGRYAHVIFPEAVHEPALALSERLLATVGRGWADKVFFSDDGCASAAASAAPVLPCPVAHPRKCLCEAQGM
jgi:adenosylmethionine-8-amino-7-oxononanoate aminotransferase